MNKMVKQLLTLTALEFGNDKPVMEQFDLVTLIKRSPFVLQRYFSIRKAPRYFLMPVEPVMVWADEFKIEEVVT